MYNAYLYAIANDGVDTAQGYPFGGYVSENCHSVPLPLLSDDGDYCCFDWCEVERFIIIASPLPPPSPSLPSLSPLPHCLPPPSFQQSGCAFDRSCIGAQISGSVSVKFGDESSLQAAVATAGPVAVAVDGSNKAFRVRELKVCVLSTLKVL